MNTVFRFVAEVSGPGAVARVRDALVRVYEADPRFGVVSDVRKAWITWTLRPTASGVFLESSEVTMFEEGAIGRDLEAALEAPVVPVGRANRVIDALTRGATFDQDDLDTLDDEPDPPGPTVGGDVVLAIGDRVMPSGSAWLVRCGVVRGERFTIDTDLGLRPRPWMELGSLGGPVPSFRARFTGAVVELLALERVEVRRLTGFRYDVCPTEIRTSPSAWEVSVPDLDLPEGRKLEMLLGMCGVAAGTGEGTLEIEAGGTSFSIGVDVSVRARRSRKGKPAR